MKGFFAKFGWPIACGIVLAFSFPTFHLFPLAWIALAPLFARGLSLSPKENAIQFFLAGYVFNVVVLQWLAANIFWAGGWGLWGHQAMCITLSLFWGALGFLWTWLRSRHALLGGALSVATLWALMEHAQGTTFSGFGWGSIGYSQGPDLALVQLAALGGGIFISSIIVAVNVLVGFAFAESKGRALRIAAAAATIGVAHGVGYAMIDEPRFADGPLTVGVLQPNFPLEMKWDREYRTEMVRNAINKSQTLNRLEPIDLMVWPEAHVMSDIELSPETRAMLEQFSRESSTALFTGAHRADGSSNFNSSHLFSKGGELVGTYDKVHLAPFGEYVPMANFLPFVQQLVPSIGAIEPGIEQKVFDTDGRTLGPLICFEVLFPRMSENLREQGADFLTVITNLAWFGSSNGIPQELEVARMRAIETRLPVVHAANTGISGMIDPWGRVHLVDVFVDGDGNAYELRDSLQPAEIVRERLVGAFPLPEPAQRPIASGPPMFPWLVGLGSVALVIAGFVLGRTPAPSEES